MITKRATLVSVGLLLVIAAIGITQKTSQWLDEKYRKATLGGDIEIALGGVPLPFDATSYMLFSSDRISRITETATLATFGEITTMVGLKGIDAAYPLYGELLMSSDDNKGPIFFNSMQYKLHGAAIDKRAMTALGLKLGDTFSVGAVNFLVRAIIIDEPDAPSPMTRGLPRVITNNSAVYATGLADEPDNRVIFRCRARLEEGINATEFVKGMDTFFDAPDWLRKDWRTYKPPQ